MNRRFGTRYLFASRGPRRYDVRVHATGLPVTRGNPPRPVRLVFRNANETGVPQGRGWYVVGFYPEPRWGGETLAEAADRFVSWTHREAYG